MLWAVSGEIHLYDSIGVHLYVKISSSANMEI